jgi:hypothetical protein
MTINNFSSRALMQSLLSLGQPKPIRDSPAGRMTGPGQSGMDGFCGLRC